MKTAQMARDITLRCPLCGADLVLIGTDPEPYGVRQCTACKEAFFYGETGWIVVRGKAQDEPRTRRRLRSE